MSIFSETKAASKLINFADDVEGEIPWTFLKFPNGTPFFRVHVERPFGAFLVPRRTQWLLVIDLTGEGDDSERVVGNVKDPPRTTVESVIRALGQVAALGALAENHPASNAFALATFSFAKSVGVAGLAGSAARILGNNALSQQRTDDGVRWLLKAQKLLRQAGEVDEVAQVELLLRLSEEVSSVQSRGPGSGADAGDLASSAQDPNWKTNLKAVRSAVARFFDQSSISHVTRDGILVGFSFIAAGDLRCRFYYDDDNTYTIDFACVDGHVPWSGVNLGWRASRRRRSEPSCDGQ